MVTSLDEVLVEILIHGFMCIIVWQTLHIVLK